MPGPVAIIDYGVGNLRSVGQAFVHVGAEPRLVSTADEVLAADRLVLPGVGAFGRAMEELRARGLIEPIRDYAATNRPLLGICLGMQMMLDRSEEFGVHDGIGLIPGDVREIRATGVDGRPHKIPHIGWSPLIPSAGANRPDAFLTEAEHGAYVYFIHSFAAHPMDDAHVVAHCLYDGIQIPAVVQKGRTIGCQFHPEKSAEVGLALIQRFLEI